VLGRIDARSGVGSYWAESELDVAETKAEAMSDRVIIEVKAGVADVRMNRPDKLNALDSAMFTALVRASAELKARSDVRAVVLSGEGRSFCAGLDFASFQAMGDSTADSNEDVSEVVAEQSGSMTHLGQQSVWGWQELDVPVICAVQGHALGGGFQLALGGDIRLVHPDTKLSALEMRWGLIPDMCASELLARLVGSDVAAELYFTAKMISGTEAVSLGVCTRLSDNPHDSAMKLAIDIASKSPQAIRHAKALINQYGKVTTAEAFANERRYMRDLIGSQNQVEAVSAFFERRDPNFTDVGDPG